jgi:hypothetical protein
MGYRRFNLDLYWDNTTSTFQLCPVQITFNATSPNATASTLTTTLIAAATIVGPTTTTTRATTLTATITVAPTASLSAPGAFLPISLPGNYTCAPGADFQAILNTIRAMCQSTDNNLREAALTILVLNLLSLPPATTNTSLIDLSNSTRESLSAQINATLGDWIYTAADLAFERSNINTTFLADKANPIVDISAYYNVTVDPETGFASTNDGWPTTRHLFETDGRRVLVGFGTVNTVPSREYNIDQDSSIIFPPGTFGTPDQLIVSSAVTNNPNSCLGPQGPVFGPQGSINFSDSKTMDVNNSFAYSTDYFTPLIPLSYSGIQNIVLCGLSPLIDSPLEDVTSGDESPYDPISATVWSWLSPDQPINVTLPTNGTTEDLDACAALDVDTGRWIVLNCDTSLQIACRANSTLYEVTLPLYRARLTDSGKSARDQRSSRRVPHVPLTQPLTSPEPPSKTASSSPPSKPREPSRSGSTSTRSRRVIAGRWVTRIVRTGIVRGYKRPRFWCR